MLRHVVSRARLMLGTLVSLALVVCCPASGAAVPFPPELTSGSFHLERGMLGGVTGGVSLSAPNGNAFSFGFLASGAFGASVTETGAFVHEGQFLSPTGGLLTIAGQSYSPSRICFDAPMGNVGPCSHAGGFFGMHADPPPFDGTPTVTVLGTYSLFEAHVSILSLPPDLQEQFPQGLFGSYTGTGPATMTFVRFADFWFFESGVAEIHPTPEPATLLLWGTSAAGLGLARWCRRRGRERAHAA
jgi:hypothetical protein